ncbi:MAG: hypothetical protein AB7U20_22840 [Planctomycetaceae bacterium]
MDLTQNARRLFGAVPYGTPLLLGVLLCVSAGCDRPSDQPNLAPVTGVVTLDNQPLAGKDVIFAPEGGRPSIGTTSELGEYKLMYTNKWEGAIVGPHKVTVSTPVPAREGDPYEENIPTRYNIDSTLTAEVKDGKNVIDFELTSD